MLVIDLLLCALSLPAAMMADFGFTETQVYDHQLPVAIPLTVIVCATFFCGSGMYRVIWRYLSLQDLVEMAVATAIALTISTALLILVNLQTHPGFVPFIQYVLLISCMFGTRIIYRRFLWYSQRYRDKGKLRIPTLVVGVNATTELFIRATQDNPHAPFTVLALLDTDGFHLGQNVHVVPFIGRVDDIAAAVRHVHDMNVRPRRILLSQSSRHIDAYDLLAAAEAASITVAFLPSLTDLRGYLEST